MRWCMVRIVVVVHLRGIAVDVVKFSFATAPDSVENVVVLADEAQCFVRVVGRDLGVIER